MRRRKKLGWRVILGLVIAGAICCLVLAWTLPGILEAARRGFMDDPVGHAEQIRVQLLCESDHQEILEAGREIMDQTRHEYRTRGLHRFPIPPDVPIPKPIENLRPHTVEVTSHDFLIVEM